MAKINYGWLKTYDNEYFAPKSILSQLYTDEGQQLKDYLNNNYISANETSDSDTSLQFFDSFYKDEDTGLIKLVKKSIPIQQTISDSTDTIPSSAAVIDYIENKTNNLTQNNIFYISQTIEEDNLNSFVFSEVDDLNNYLIYYNGILLNPVDHYTIDTTNKNIVILNGWSSEKNDIISVLGKHVPDQVGTTITTANIGQYAPVPEEGTGIDITKANGKTIINHSNSIIAGTIGSNSNYTATWGAAFAVPYITYDAQGHITATGTCDITIPDKPTTVKCTSTASTETAYPILACSASSPTSGMDYEAIYTSSVTLKNNVLMGAAWNDYAEYRISDCREPGRVICENGDDTLSLATERLQPAGNVISDTFGFAIGETEMAKTPIAVSGRVLVYPYEDRYSYNPGDAVCAAPGGTVSKMTREEIITYPERIIGTVSAIPEYKTWGEGNVLVNGRIWIKIK